MAGPTGHAGFAVEEPRDRTRSPETLALASEPLPLTIPARIYVCGITPYDVTHLGHASAFVWTDVISRVIRMTGVDTVVTRNVTDVDDVLTRAAAERGRPFDELGRGRQEVNAHCSLCALRGAPAGERLGHPALVKRRPRGPAGCR